MLQAGFLCRIQCMKTIKCYSRKVVIEEKFVKKREEKCHHFWSAPSPFQEGREGWPLHLGRYSEAKKVVEKIILGQAVRERAKTHILPLVQIFCKLPQMSAELSWKDFSFLLKKSNQNLPLRILEPAAVLIGSSFQTFYWTNLKNVYTEGKAPALTGTLETAA